MTSTLSGKSCLSFLSSANNEMEVINFDFFWVFFFIHLFIYLFIYLSLQFFFAFHGVLLNINGMNKKLLIT